MAELIATCGHANRPGAHFCSDCGSALGARCPTCAADLRAGARFCDACGTPLTRTPVAAEAPRAAAPMPEGERKQVTVLFADVVKSMDLAERLDPDELTQIMTGLVQVCREAVERFGGTIDKFTGDGVMALFGAPIAQEDHARRACHAALALLEGARAYALTLRQRDIDLVVRVGLNSGEVVAGSVAEAFTAIGHTVGLAQRMEGLAEPGAVYVSEHTAALISEAFRLRNLGKVAVKGSAMPIGVYAVQDAAGGSSAPGRRRGGSARMVGRDEEFAALKALLERTRDGRSQVVGLVGEAGAGKSRLCEELSRHANDLGVTVRRTSGVSHAQTVPLLPILGLFRDYFAIGAEDLAAQTRDKVRSRLLSLDPELADELGLIFDFLEVPDPECPAPRLGPDARRRRILETLRRATHKRSAQDVLLVILEDLHWFDPQSVAFLEAWLPSFAGTRTLIVTNFRPEFHPPWTGQSSYRQLPLAPLDTCAVGELLDELLGPGEGLSLIAPQLLVRAGGNPFFAEEIVRGLAGDGTLTGEPGAYELVRPAREVRIPPTVQAVLAARIDRLSAHDKAVLQAAAVIGRTFTETLLAATAGQGRGALGDALQLLRAGELVQETGTPGEYRFWHPLTQEVAYGTLVVSARRRLHRCVAEALLTTGADRHDELAALVATHFEAAEVALEAARWQLRAATRAFRSDLAQAQNRLHSALEHLETIPPTAESRTLAVHARILLLRAGARTGMDAGEADRILAAARPDAELLGDPALLSGLSMADGTVRYFTGDCAGGLASHLEGGRHAEQTEDLGLRAFAEVGIAAGYAHAGPLADGLVAADRAIAVCAGDPARGTAQFGFSVHDFGYWARTALCIPAGMLGEARMTAHASLELFRQRPVAEWHSWTLAFLAHIADLTAEPADADAAGAVVDEALRLADDSGNINVRVAALQGAAIVALLTGRHESALAGIEEALTTARKHRSGLWEEAALLCHLARAHLALADLPAARATADEAVSVARAQGAKVVECFAHLVRTRILRATATATGDADLAEARAAVDAGDALAAETGALTYAAFLTEERARLDNDPVALKAAADAYTAIGATGHARRLHAELAIA